MQTRAIGDRRFNGVTANAFSLPRYIHSNSIMIPIMLNLYPHMNATFHDKTSKHSSLHQQKT
jgi:hypothetical protein